MTLPGAGAGAGAGAETETGKDAGETGGGAGRFADRAVWLAGLAGWHLGWSPEAFWRATPAEMETVVRAVRTGKLGFEDLRAVALAALNEIARSALASGLSSLGLGSGGGTGGLGAWSALGGVATAALGLPGRATGGPVSAGRAYRVGENGPELFVPTASGTVVPTASGGGRDVRVAIAVTAPQGTAPAALTRSARQIARTVRGALDR